MWICACSQPRRWCENNVTVEKPSIKLSHTNICAMRHPCIWQGHCECLLYPSTQGKCMPYLGYDFCFKQWVCIGGRGDSTNLSCPQMKKIGLVSTSVLGMILLTHSYAYTQHSARNWITRMCVERIDTADIRSDLYLNIHKCTKGVSGFK